MSNLLTRYPVLILDIVKFVLGGFVAMGWATAPQQPVTDVGTGVMILAWSALTWVTHSMVTPTVNVPPTPEQHSLMGENR